MYLGIDFGTTYSEPATLYQNHPIVLLSPGVYGIPSLFYYDSDTGVIIGDEADASAIGTAAANLIKDIKMVQADTRSFTIDGHTFSAQEIISYIYTYILNQAIEVAAQKLISPLEIEGLVITVPAKFPYEELSLLQRAARQAIDEFPDCAKASSNINIAILEEPVAAALSYFNTSLEDNTNILVYDLGGGTCDIALVCSDSNRLDHFKVIDNDMIRYGGRNWDQAVADQIIADKLIQATQKFDLLSNPGYQRKILKAAERVKLNLSANTNDNTAVNIEIDGIPYRIRIRRSEFENVTSSYMEQTIDCLQALYNKYNDEYPISKIICVGGSSNMPQIPQTIEQRFPHCEVHVYQPEYAVSYGAAIYASLLKDNPVIPVISKGCNFSYGTDAYDFEENLKIFNLVKKGSELPATGEQSFITRYDNTTRMRFAIYETDEEGSECDYAVDKRDIGYFYLDFKSPVPKGYSVTATMTINSNGLMETEAHDQNGNHIAASFQLSRL